MFDNLLRIVLDTLQWTPILHESDWLKGDAGGGQLKLLQITDLCVITLHEKLPLCVELVTDHEVRKW